MSPARPDLSPGFMVVHGNHPESLRDLLSVEVGEQGDELKLLHEYIQF